MQNLVRYNLARELSRYFIYHLREEIEKPSNVSDYITIEGISFKDFTRKMIHDLENLFPDLSDRKPKFHLFKHWWTREFMRVANIDLEYSQTTFKTQNQIFLFKILDIHSPNQERRNRFAEGISNTMKVFRARGRSVTFEVIFSSEVKMFPLLEKIVQIENLPFFKSKNILYEQNIFIQKTAYSIIDIELKESYEKTEKILKAILPEKIVEELKTKGKVKPELLESVSVLFCDLEGFTKISSTLSPENLLNELNDCYIHFDKIFKLMNIEKIKTIGDSYMACAGIDSTKKMHAIDSILAALRIHEFLRKYEKSQIRKNLPSWKVRIGIHSGKVVAGILGNDRFNYDIWGDTVNVAQRMEASGVAGRVNVSEETMQLAEKFFTFEKRGKISVKGKGELEQFFVIGIKSELSLNQKMKTPNKKFKSLYMELAI